MQLKIRDAYSTELQQCLVENSGDSKNLNNCKSLENEFNSSIASTSAQIADLIVRADTEKVLWDRSEEFSPTQNRLNSLILRFFMGSDHLPIQR